MPPYIGFTTTKMCHKRGPPSTHSPAMNTPVQSVPNLYTYIASVGIAQESHPDAQITPRIHMSALHGDCKVYYGTCRIHTP